MSEQPAPPERPAKIVEIERCGYVRWSSAPVSPALKQRFDAERIPVRGVRHVRIWGLQVDDERALPGRERTSIPDEDLWEISLQARDGSVYEVSFELVEPVT